jgi:hypothetical protein
MAQGNKFEVEITGKITDLEKAVNEAKGELGGLSKSVGGLGSAFKMLGPIIAGAFSAAAIGDFIKDSVQAAAKAQGIEAAFRRLNGVSLADLRKATRDTVNDVELMRLAVRAENFQVPLSKLATYFEFATKRAAQTGESVDYLVNSIIDGIGRKSTLVMDNLGISAAALQQEIKKVGDFGVAAGNLIEDALGKMGDVALTAEQQFAQVRTAVDNLKVDIGNKLMPITQKWLDMLLKGLEVIEYWTRTPEQEGRSAGQATVAAAQSMANTANAMKILSQRIKEVNEELRIAKEEAVSLAGTNLADKHIENTQKFTAELEVLKAGLAGIQMAQAAADDAASKTVVTIGKLTENAKELEQQMQDAASVAEYQRLNGELQKVLAQIERIQQSVKKTALVPSEITSGGLPNLTPQIPTLGLMPQQEIEGFNNSMLQSFEVMRQYNDIFAYSQTLAWGFGDAINAAIFDGENFGESMKQVLQQVLKQLISVVAQALVLSAILNAISGGSGAFGSIFGQLINGGSASPMSLQGIWGTVQGQNLSIVNQRAVNGNNRAGIPGGG